MSNNIVHRWILSRTFKNDINIDYGIYPEDGEDIVMEAVHRNVEYSQSTGRVTSNVRQVSDYENWEDEYDKMYA